MEEQVEVIFSSFSGDARELVPLLQHTQEVFGYLPEKVMRKIAQFTNVPESKVFGVASFYAQFRLKPMGRNRVMVCRGTACHVRGAPQILEEISRDLEIEVGGTSEDLEYTLETVACLGCCALAPCMMINDDVHGRLTLKKVSKMFKPEKKEEEE